MSIPMRKLFLLFLTGLVTLSASAQTQGDNLRAETRLDQVYQQYSLDGSGVIVAMIERGIDYTHPDFIDDQGNTRIAFIYDMLNPAGANAPGNPYGIGTIYTRAEIDAALDANTALGSTDRFGHGTACTGIAAGDGSGMSGAPYRGAAPGATIIAVKVTHDAFPATGTVAAQAGFYNPDYLPVAFQFVRDKSTELGLPCVALLNLGSISGPTDGSSALSRAMEDFGGSGRILVCGVGDDGGGANRAADTLTQGGISELLIKKGNTGNLRLEVWYNGDDRLDVSVVYPNGNNSGALPAPATNQTSATQSLTGLNYYHRGADQDFAGSDNGQRQILIDISGDTGTYVVRLQGNTIVNGTYFASLNPAYFSNKNRFQNHIFPGASINDLASSFNIIVPTDYVFDSTYVDIDGVSRRRSGQGAQGDLWAGSSEGPTLDGRLGVDIAVPGELSFGAYSPNTYYSQFRFNMIEGSGGLYGIQNAVSGAAPTLTGTIALMLQVNPALTTTQVRTLLHQSARQDAFTGAVPNPSWGYGKLDALAAIQATYGTLSVKDKLSAAPFITFSPNPAADVLHYKWQTPGADGQVTLLDLQGRRLADFVLSGEGGDLVLPDVAPGLYLLHTVTADTHGYTRLIIR
ncbi:MAG: S8 family peptidase [Bacteroidia bacterium]|nr:S8 family peptidase [Bacteroidia bacterium]